MTPAAAGADAARQRIRSEFLRLISTGEATSRADIAQVTGLARSTVSLYVTELIDAGVCTWSEERTGGRGRPPERLSVQPQGTLIAVVDLQSAGCGLGLFSFGGQQIAASLIEVDLERGPQHAVTETAGGLEKLLAQHDAGAGDLAMMVVSVPAPVDETRRLIASRAALAAWAGYPLAEAFEDWFTTRTVLENDANLSALGEAAVRADTESPLALLKLSVGIGCGLVTAEGHLHTGADGVAGDIGHVRSSLKPDEVCICGRTGCIGSFASIERILSRIGLPSGAHGDYASGITALTERITAGEPEALLVLREAAQGLGELAATIVDMFNPRTLVISGELTTMSDEVLSTIRSVVYSRAIPAATMRLVVTPSLDSSATLRGGARLAAQWLLSSPGTDYLLARLHRPKR